MSRAMKLPKLHCFAAVSLYTQLPVVLQPNDLNINFIPITTSFTTHSLPYFGIETYYEIYVIYASFNQGNF